MSLGTTHDADPRVVLLLEDDEDLRDALSEALSAAGYVALVAATGASALADTEHRRLAAAVVDLHLPGALGVDVANELRRRDPNLHLVLMSGHHDGSGLPAGVALLRKPFGVDRLLSALASRA
jgi:DNA-binding response OmpR family regulator